jgi:two-component system, CitB family, response regulator MalR
VSDSEQPTLSILVVEDDPGVADLLRVLLNDVDGWAATVAHDAAEARAIVQQVRLGVVVLDINLPGISGLELLELLRQDENWQEPPVIIVSSAVDEPHLRQAIRRARASKVLSKPFDVDQVIAAIRESVAS